MCGRWPQFNRAEPPPDLWWTIVRCPCDSAQGSKFIWSKRLWRKLHYSSSWRLKCFMKPDHSPGLAPWTVPRKYQNAHLFFTSPHLWSKMDPNYPPTWVGAAPVAASLPVILPFPSASVHHLKEMWPLRLAHWWEQPGMEQSVNQHPRKLKALTRVGERWAGSSDPILYHSRRHPY